ncbi:fluoride efflux transporter CrcB [Nostoc sp. CHAB 5836]|uniref:fluoride efflux transporter CrcB n=1 Tax=Nostoc sp. CHAB 5836 TaxID=2780404 RepID=UPI001E329F0A|nr:fluoride efflux transporter CrcB [Nostoc sp. CHAB 5836]MCC5617520.1 fluoride efflux transporter CrcB [Nostoc sp. CHAB 5836]
MSEPVINAIAISLGAVPGALGRYYITELSKKLFGNTFPYGTLIINITGCFCMGFFMTLISGIANFPTELMLMVATGFLGTYTTFSTYGFDTLTLWRHGKVGVTTFYGVGSAIFGLIGIQLGAMLARQMSL